MRQVKWWQRMMAWALVGVLIVGLWATPGWAKKPKEEERPKPTEGEIIGLLVALEDEWPEVKKLAFEQLAHFDGQSLKRSLKQPEVIAKIAFDILKDRKVDAYVRESAAKALSNIGDAANPYVKDILDILKDEQIDASVRVGIAEALGNRDVAKSYVKDILDILKDEQIDDSVRGHTASVLSKLGDVAQPYVKDVHDFLTDKKNSAYVRANAVDALGNLGDVAQPYVKDILDFLKDEKVDASLRTTVADALGNLGDAAKPYAKDILDILKDSNNNASVRTYAAEALGNLGDAAKPYAKDILDILKDENNNVEVRGRAAEALGNLGNAAQPYIKDILDILKDEKIDASVRTRAAEALGNLGNATKPYVKTIHNLFKDEKVDASVRGCAALALVRLGDVAKPYVKDIFDFLKDEKTNASMRVSIALELGRLGDVAKLYVKDLLDILKDEKVDASVRGSAAEVLGNLGDAAKPHVKDILEFLKDEKIDSYMRGSAAEALANLGNAAKPYVKDLVGILKNEKIDASVRARVADALSNFGSDTAKPYMRDCAKLLGNLFLQLSNQNVYITIHKLGGLTLADSLPIVNAIYGHTPTLQRGRFLIKVTTKGDKDTVTLLNWVGKPKTTPKKLTHDEARTTLKIFQTAWDASADLPELRADLATQTREITNNRHITWQADDIPLLTGLATALKTSGYTSADLDNAIQSIALYKWGTTIGKTILAHLVFWIGLIFFYPKSPQIQAIFFWNPWVRNIAGLGYVSFLLTWIPFLRDRLLSPFRTSLLADANLLNQAPNTHYFPTSQARPRNSSDLESLPRFQGQLILEGESGLGKTMYLRQLVQTSRRNTVYLTAQRCENGVLEAIQDKLEGNAKDPNFLQSLIYSRALDICIDGLNEVSPDTRAKITQFLERNFQGNFILTTQPLNGWNPPKTAKIYELQPLSPDQIREFLHSRIDTLPSTSLITGLEYTAACDKVFNQYLAMLKDTPTDEAKKIRRIFSNPMDLTLIAHTIAANETPDPFRLQAQDYKRMSDRYTARFNQSFPLKAFAEAVYTMRLNDQDSIPVTDFGDELEIMEEAKMVITRTSRAVTNGEAPRTLWNFRHDKILEYFLVQLFLGKTPEADNRKLEHLDDPRFRGVYFLLADLMPLSEAQELRETLIQYAVDTQDHTVSDRFIELLRPRSHTFERTALN
jgi:HEAT repeat protein